MEGPGRELNAVLVGSKSSRKYLVGNIILGRQAFDPADVTCRCERGEGEVCGRRVSLVKAPGWLRGYTLCNTPELFKTEAILSVTLCPPALHAFILVINAELPFKNEYNKATREHLQHFFGGKVWDHTIVVFSHRGELGHKTIEDYIEREGAPLRSILEACGNRYHLLCDDGTDNNKRFKELFENVDAMVAKNRCYEADSTLIQSVESRRKEVDKKAEEMQLQTQQQRKQLRSLLTESTLDLRILMVGWVFSGKTATGNNIFSAEVFQSGDRTMKASKQSGEVAGRKVVLVDTPGWWKFFPPMFTPSNLKSEILKGVSLCSPSPNAILLAVPADTSFTEEQRRITEGNMRLLGQRVWRHVMVLFTIGDSLGDKTIEQHIKSEGEPLRWLIEKCGNRYHVLNNACADGNQVTELLQKMEEMVAGNSSFYLSAYPETDDPPPEEDRSDCSSEKKYEITEHLLIEWDRSNWEKYHSRQANRMSDVKSEGSEEEEEQIKQPNEDDQFKTYFGSEVKGVGDAEGGPLHRWMGLLEEEWNRREVCVEQAAWRYFHTDESTTSEDSYRLRKSRENVTWWLKNHYRPTTSGRGADSGTYSISGKSEEDLLREESRQIEKLNAVLVGSKSSRKDLVGNIILGRQAFDPADVTCRCERGEGEVCGRRVSLVKAPGWLRGYTLCNTSELFKTEAILSVTLCPPALHAFILVINAELPFKNEYNKATREHLQHFFGGKVWDHTIVVFNHRGELGHKTIEDYIEREGAPLRSILEACGNRYHLLCDDGTDNNKTLKELFENVDAMVAKNRCYEADSTLIQSVESRRKEVDKKAEEMQLQTQQQRQKLRSLLTESTPDLKILMVGWVFSGKTATGNNIFSAEVFQSGDRTAKASKQSGEVAGRKVILVDTPGWWKFFPAIFTPSNLKSEILKGVSLCSPSPNAILLIMPADTSFTEDQRRVTEGNMRLLGQRVWRHVMVLFTCGDFLGNKTIEQHIESEGKPLRWLIEKCGNRYHVLNNACADGNQVTELLQKMEEMVAGNSFFYLSAYPETDDPPPEEDRSDCSNENKDEITEHLLSEWDRSNWEKYHSRQANRSLIIRPSMSDVKSMGSEEEEEQIKQPNEDDQFKTYFGSEFPSEGDAGAGPLHRWMRLLEEEWRRREACMEHAAQRLFHTDESTTSEDSYRLHKSRENVTWWLKNHYRPTTSGRGADSGTYSISGKSEEDLLREESRQIEIPSTEN
ncbi:uncharacterized protein LOC131959971 [Centropristis striata]|uniref:uncharacterized protein LOC131959971 n=1 Tax=Centropristis striata TaxID=184440 RepID=UPI0027E187A7|nr:uncharacterized protein LOC131959971 [Centropristis striata]